MLTEAEKTDTRRFCGYPPLGAQPASSNVDHRLTQLSGAELAVLRDYLTTLRSLEQAIPAAAENLDTAQVAVWSHNPNELRDRTRLFDDWCQRLCNFLGIAPGVRRPRSGISFIV